MKKTLFISFIAGVCMLASGCDSSDSPNGGSKQPYHEIQISATEKEAVNVNNDFGIKLFKQMSDTPEIQEENIAISPYSIFSFMSMIANGDNGETQREILDTFFDSESLKIDDYNAFHNHLLNELPSHDKSATLKIANSLWLDKSYSYNDSFVEILKNRYLAECFNNYPLSSDEARIAINNWVSTKTNGLIQNILKKNYEKSERIVLVNTIYFMGKWEYQFDKGQTADSEFTNANGSKKTVKMMKFSDKLINYADDDNMMVFYLPYNSNNYGMTIICPKENGDINDFIKNLDIDKINNMRFVKVKLSLEMPKFEVNYMNDLSSVLYKSGMKKPFDINYGFNNISDEKVSLPGILHNCIIKVDEEGTEAAAATINEGFISPSPMSPVSVKLDRPFVFTINESSTGTILFIGTIKSL